VRPLVLAILAFAGAGTAGEEPAWQALPLPGGIAGLCRAADLDPCAEPWRVLDETSRRLHPTYGDPANTARLRQRVRAHLKAAEPRLAHGLGQPSAGLPVSENGGAGSPGDTVLLPLPARLWRGAVLGKSVTDDRLVAALLDDRAASLLYRGLFQLDEPSLRFFEEHADLLSWIKENRAEVFSVFAGSIRVRDGHVDVPGGTEAAALWQDLVGESPARAARFLRKLFERDEGRQAFFFHTLDHLAPPAALRFALGSARDDPERRRERLRALADAFGRGSAWWRPEGGAFARPLVDPAVVLGLVRVGADGRPTAPAGRAFWEAAFAGQVPAAGDAARLQQGLPFDAAWIAAQVGLAPTSDERRVRLTQLAFAQRAFANLAPEELADALFALRGLVRYPALVLLLDRMDVRTPAIYAGAVRRAGSLPSRAEDHRDRATLAQFQATLAILDRARFEGALEAADAESLVRSLCAVPLEGGRYSGAVGEWIDERLLPAFTRAVGGDSEAGSAEEIFVDAMAGARLAADGTPPFEWEGLWYRAAPGVAERRRLTLVRARQGGNTLDTVLVFSRAARRLREGHGPEGLARLRDAASRLEPGTLPSERAGDLEARSSVGPARARGLVEAADELLAETLISLAYAPHLGSAQGTALAGANVATRHEFGIRAWALPEEVLGSGPWRVRGSLLGLDAALASLSLRRLTGAVPEHAPRLDPSAALAFARAVAFRSPFALRNEEMNAIAEAIARGRERAAEARGVTDSEGLAHGAGLDPWRAQGLRCTLEREPRTVAAFFTLEELMRLGRPEAAPSDPWGTPDLARGGSLRLVSPPPGGHDDLLGQRLEDLHAARAPDLVLRVAVELESRHLPASLVPGVLSMFVQDFVQEATPSSHEDWLALARFARDAPTERFDEYVSALVGEGPLVPAPEPGEPSTQ
jgi:hypothetical protein